MINYSLDMLMFIIKYNDRSFRVTYYMGQVTEICEVHDSKSTFIGDNIVDLHEGYYKSVCLTVLKYILKGHSKLEKFFEKVNKKGGDRFMRRANNSLGYQYPMLHLSRGGSEEAIEVILKDPRVR